MKVGRSLFDVDIDVSPSTDREKYGTRAGVYVEERGVYNPHPSGIYLEDVPTDPISGICAFDYKYGDEKGFMRVDLLNNTIYSGYKSKEEVLQDVDAPVDWDLLKQRDVVESLPHISKHFDLVREVEPKSIIELADVLALIRPAKQRLIEPYLENRELTRENLYREPKAGIYFKKSHAVSYALMIVCAMRQHSTKHGIIW